MVTFWGSLRPSAIPMEVEELSVNLDHVVYASNAGTFPFIGERGANMSGPFCILYLTSGAGPLWVNSSLASLKSRSR
jgi:hypothetical protein